MTSDVLKIALIVGSTRPNRFADVPARWIVDAATARDDLVLEVLDLRDWALQGKRLDDYDHLIKARTAMLDELVWWGRALRSAREATAEVDSIA